MKVFDKIRDLFTEEVEVEAPAEAPIKKEVIQVEIKAPEVALKEVEEEQAIPEEKINERIAERLVERPVENKVRPSVFFDEHDFDDIVKKEEPKIEPVEAKEPVHETYTGRREVEERKKFSPTPIISPVYGVLDKNYKKDDIVDRPRRTVDNDNMTVDDVRNKAYGTLEDELEGTLFGKTSIMFASREEKLDYDELEEELKDAADALDLLREDPVIPERKQEEQVEEPKKEEKIEKNPEPEHKEEEIVHTRKKETIEDLLNASFAIDRDEFFKDADVNLKKDFKSDDKLSESDFLNLIDDMYEKGDK